MLDALFNPRGVAVVGASTKELHIGNRVIKNLIDFGYKGEIYPINPKADEIHGLKAYKSILDVPGAVDVAHMVIPAKFVPMAFEDCGKKGVKHIIINSGGFSEVGEAGAAIEKAFMEVARKYDMRVFGPNCQGIINSDPAVRAYCNFTFTFPDVGHISIVALSGGVAEVIHQGFAAMGVGTRIYASNGNACDITIPEIMRYLGEDEGTRVIVTYVEGLRDAQTFMDVAREVAAKKPVLAMKAGRTAEGAKAASSHTGGLAKEDLATDCIFEKAGILSFRDEGQLIDAAAAFASEPIPRGNRVGIITNTGGPAVIATDVLVDAGLTLPPLSEKTKADLTSQLYSEASVANPVDVLATGNAQHYRACLDAMMADDAFDMVYVNFVTPFFVDTESIAHEIAAVHEQRIKPIVCNLMTDRSEWAETVAILQAAGVPCFSLPSDAARAMTALVRYARMQQREKGVVETFGDVEAPAAQKIIEEAQAAGRKQLSAQQVYGMLAAYGLPVAPWQVVSDERAAVAAANAMGYPVVVKADADSVVHKSDMGGVAIDLNDAAAVASTINDMAARFDDKKLRFLVQKQMPAGLETIIGAKAEPGLGHLLMFGMGGVYVEVLKDVVFNLTPIDSAEAGRMLAGIKLAPLLEGVRGQSGVDRGALKNLLLRLSQLLTDLPMIAEMDLNPVIAYGDGVCAVDARISL